MENQNTQQDPFVKAIEAAPEEIMQGLSVEEMHALFLDNALIEPSYKVYQLNSKGHRYYYRINEDGTPEFFPSVTTIISQTTPTAPHLIKWIAEKGYEEAEAYKQERAAYGTFMHAIFEELIINRTYDLDALKDELLAYIERHRLPVDFVYHADELKKDILAFAQFVKDYDVRPLAVEIALVHPTYCYAGMIDLPCTMKSSPKSDERITAIVDFKSGKKGFFEDYEIQLHLYKMMWNENFPEMPIDRVFNFAPKDWRKSPTYTLKDQTKSAAAAKIPHLLAIASIEDDKRENVFTSVGGTINLDADVSLDENITTLTLADIVKKREEAKNGKEIDAEGVSKNDLKSENAELADLSASNDCGGTTMQNEKEKPADGKIEKNNLEDPENIEL